jgi:hypothetical protein
MSVRILHVCEVDKFTLPLSHVIENHIATEGHVFLYRKTHYPSPYPSGFVTGGLFSWLRQFATLGKQAERIILHGLFDSRVFLALFLQPWLLAKCYWVIWGGDLYTTLTDAMTPKLRLREAFKRPIIKRIGHLVTYVRGDVALARSVYRARGKVVECLMYPSNIVEAGKLPAPRKHSTRTILVGNSADDSNNHADIFEKLRTLDDGQFEVLCPLSYGDVKYGAAVRAQGEALFGKRFKPLMQMMPYDEYLELLAGVDIAIFAHKRQQAMGVTIALLGMGKKVFIRSDVPQWETFSALKLDVRPYESLELGEMDDAVAETNRQRVADYFALPRLVSQLRTLFGE